MVVKFTSARFNPPPIVSYDGHEKTAEEEADDWQMADRYNGYLTFQIKNEGSEQLENVLLTTFYGGVARIFSEAGPAQEILFHSPIKIGSIAPSRTVSIQAWISDYPTIFWNEKIRITHNKGVARLLFKSSMDNCDLAGDCESEWTATVSETANP